MEFEEQEEEIGFGPSYEDSPGNSNSTPSKTPTAVPAVRSLTKSKYKECLKNHAVGIGGHAVDGCGEFIPAGEDGTIESLKCAACNCHRSFHRKEQIGGGATTFAAYHHHHHHLMAYRGPPGGYLHVQHHRPPFLALPSTSGGGGGSELDDFYNNNNNNHYQSSGGSGRKRFRTKFTQDQKEKMVNLAGRLGWRIQKQDEEIVQQFCEEMGIKRHVLKVWMHNNKHTLGKKP